MKIYAYMHSSEPSKREAGEALIISRDRSIKKSGKALREMGLKRGNRKIQLSKYNFAER